MTLWDIKFHTSYSGVRHRLRKRPHYTEFCSRTLSFWATIWTISRQEWHSRGTTASCVSEYLTIKCHPFSQPRQLSSVIIKEPEVRLTPHSLRAPVAHGELAQLWARPPCRHPPTFDHLHHDRHHPSAPHLVPRTTPEPGNPGNKRAPLWPVRTGN